MTVRAVCSVAGVILGSVLTISVPVSWSDAHPLRLLPLSDWTYDSLYRWATMGLVSLRDLATRPLTLKEARSLVGEAVRNAMTRPGGVPRGLALEFRSVEEELALLDAPVSVTLGGSLGAGKQPLNGISRTWGESGFSLDLAHSDGLVIEGRLLPEGSPADNPRDEFYGSFSLGTVTGQVGRVPLYWGPSLRSSLLLSDNAGALLGMRVVADLGPVRLTKVVASLDRQIRPQGDTAILVGTRLDWMATPVLRVGVSEADVTAWGYPLTPLHLVEPLPVLFSAVASAFLQDVIGAPHNTLASIDFDWLVGPGTRLYGGVMADDFPGWPSHPRWEGALLGGVQVVNLFGAEGRSLRIEYSMVTNGTYSYRCCGLDYAYLGQSLGHWLGPDGDDLYLELEDTGDPTRALKIFYAYTRHGQGFIGQPQPGPQDWFLSGTVERRHTLGVELHNVYAPDAEADFLAELSSTYNLDNNPGAQGLSGFLGLEVTYQWPLGDLTSRRGTGAADSRRTLDGLNTVRPSLPGSESGTSYHVALHSWTGSVTSHGPLSVAPEETLLGVTGETTMFGVPLVLAVEGDPQSNQVFWSVEGHYALWNISGASASLSGGVGGFRVRGFQTGSPDVVNSIAPRVGAEFSYPLVSGSSSPWVLHGEVSSTLRGSITSVYFWTYSLGVKWSGQHYTAEAGYRGMAALWKVGQPDQASLLWNGVYLTVTPL